MVLIAAQSLSLANDSSYPFMVIEYKEEDCYVFDDDDDEFDFDEIDENSEVHNNDFSTEHPSALLISVRRSILTTVVASSYRTIPTMTIQRKNLPPMQNMVMSLTRMGLSPLMMTMMDLKINIITPFRVFLFPLVLVVQ